MTATADIGSAVGSVASDWPLRPRPTWRTVAAALLAAACAVVVPLMVSDYTVVLLIDVLILGLLAASLGLLIGHAGLPSLGHAAYSGLAAYATGLMAKNVSDAVVVQLAVGVAVGAAAAAAVGLVAVRTRGVYFLMFTLAVAELVRALAESRRTLTGGTDGLTGIPRMNVLPGIGRLDELVKTYWVVLGATALAAVALVVITSSPFVRSLNGIRENEARMSAVGYPVARYKYAAFVAAGAFAGFGGTLMVVDNRYVSPGDAGFAPSAIVLLVLVVGGVRSVPGAFAGALVVVMVRDEVAKELVGHRDLLLGVLFLVVVYLIPGGIATGVGRLRTVLVSRTRRSAHAS